MARMAVLNKFRILKERHVQMRKPYQSPGRMKNSSYYIGTVEDWTHDLPHTVASNMVKVSHASATEAVADDISAVFFWNLRTTKPIHRVYFEGSAPLSFWDRRITLEMAAIF